MDADNDPAMRELDRVAAAWVVRLTSGHATAREREDARAWASQSPRHRAAFERARTLWQLSGPRPVAPARQPPRRAWAAAAAIAALAAVLQLAVPPHWQADYRTGIAEVKSVVLADRSSVMLDAGSAIDIDFRATLRRVELLQGAALFDVRSDPRRPFEVHGLDVRASARGTRYSVRRDGPRVEVLVAQGSVSVESGHTSPLLLQPGQRARFDDGRLLALESDVNITNALAWRHGRLVFELTPLEKVVDTLNRYRHGHIAIAGERTGQLPVSGVFQLSRLDEALDTLVAALPVRRLSLTDQLVLLY